MKHSGKLAVLFLVLALCAAAQMSYCSEAATDMAAIGLAATADLASTHYALSQCASCREGNPLLQSSGARLAVKAATVAAITYGCERLRSKGHKRAAKVLRWGTVVAWGGVAAWNMHQARRAK